jgi:transposase
VDTFFLKNNDSVTVTQRVFRHFDIGRNGKVPTRQTILNWVTQFRTTASNDDKKPPGRPRTVRTPENVRRVAHAFQRSPQPYLQWSSPE